MSDQTAEAPAALPEAPAPAPSPLREIVQPFIDLLRAPRALWAINLSYFLEGLVYFGWLTLLGKSFTDVLGVDEVVSGWLVGSLTFGITLSMVFLGGVADRWNPRRSIVIALSLMLLGRSVMVASNVLLPAGGGVGSGMFFGSLLGILGIVVGYGLYQPAAYAAVRKFTTEREATMGYAMLYAVMNFGGFLPAFISPPMRTRFGINSVFALYAGLTLVGLVVFAVLLSSRAAKEALARAEAGKSKPSEAAPQAEAPRGVVEWLKRHPLADPKFAFFIFALIPVQTLFAHYFFTLPMYVDRALGTLGQEYFETFTNLNSILIFVLTPIVAALTSKRPIYGMMIAGTLVMAAPTFLLAIAPNIWLLLIYVVVGAVGEAMWQPRFLQYAAEIAPEGKTAAYVGVAQLPWFLTKFLNTLYAGWMVKHFCPKPDSGLPQNTETMWLIFACIAMVSPVLLVVARPWLGKMRERA